MHYAKYGKVAVGSILLHSDRGIDRPDTHEHSNENIDKSKTHLNYDLKDRSGLTAYEYYKERIDKIAKETKERTGKGIRKDAVTLCSWAVTAPRDLPEDKLSDFFRGAYKWFEERYGEDNIVTAAVHMDETTPHMHLQFTPIIEKDGIRKLCAKDIETRKTLQTAHKQLQKRLEQELGCKVNILNGATGRVNKDILELQNETLKQQITEKEEKARQAEERAEQAEKREKNAEQNLQNVTAQYEIEKEELEKVLEKKIKASEVKKPFRNRETVTYDKSMIESIKAISSEVHKELSENVKVRQEIYMQKQTLEQEEKQIRPMYNQAKMYQEEARRKRDEAEQIRKEAEQKSKEQEQRIEQCARIMAEEMVHQMFYGVKSLREERLEEFCDELKYEDGTSILDVFEEEENELKARAKSKGFER